MSTQNPTYIQSNWFLSAPKKCFVLVVVVHWLCLPLLMGLALVMVIVMSQKFDLWDKQCEHECKSWLLVHLVWTGSILGDSIMATSYLFRCMLPNWPRSMRTIDVGFLMVEVFGPHPWWREIHTTFWKPNLAPYIFSLCKKALCSYIGVGIPISQLILVSTLHHGGTHLFGASWWAS